MMKNRRPTVQETKVAIDQLEEALRDLAMFTEPTNDNCSISAAAREESRLFMTSYVETPIDVALTILRRAIPPTT